MNQTKIPKYDVMQDEPDQNENEPDYQSKYNFQEKTYTNKEAKQLEEEISHDKLISKENEQEIMSYAVKIHDIEIENLRNESVPKLDCSSYFLASQIIETTIPLGALLLRFPFQVLIFFWQLGKNPGWKPIQDFITYCTQWILLIVLFAGMFLPSALVCGTQFICVNQLLLENPTDGLVLSDESLMAALQVLMGFFFGFIAMREVSSACDVIAYFYKLLNSQVSFTDGGTNICVICLILFILPWFILPQIIQIVITFYVFFISVALILSTDGTANLIQNFAGLSILLEFDDIVMAFLRYVRYHQVMNMFIECLSNDRNTQIAAKKEELFGAYIDCKFALEEEQLKIYKKIESQSKGAIQAEKTFYEKNVLPALEKQKKEIEEELQKTEKSKKKKFSGLQKDLDKTNGLLAKATEKYNTVQTRLENIIKLENDPNNKETSGESPRERRKKTWGGMARFPKSERKEIRK